MVVYLVVMGDVLVGPVEDPNGVLCGACSECCEADNVALFRWGFRGVLWYVVLFCVIWRLQQVL